MKILFICSGNVFRSMTAEYCLKDYLEKNTIQGVNVSSAGTHFRDEKGNAIIIEELMQFGIDASKHKRRNVTKEILEKANLIVAMARYHQVFLKESLGFESVLFNEVCYGVKTSIDDNWEAVSDYESNKDADRTYIKGIVDYIHDSTPKFAENFKKFIK